MWNAQFEIIFQLKSGDPNLSSCFTHIYEFYQWNFPETQPETQERVEVRQA